MINEMATENWTDKHLVSFYFLDLFLRRYTYLYFDVQILVQNEINICRFLAIFVVFGL